MTNAVSTADLAWWRSPCHPRPIDIDPVAVSILRDELARAASLPGALGLAVRHVLWALSWRAIREDGAIRCTNSYVANGCGVSMFTASGANRLVAQLLCAERDGQGWWTVCSEGVAACFDLTAELAPTAPAPLVTQRAEPTGPILLLRDLPNRERGVTRCPCGDHRNGDASPSMMFDRRTRIGTCLTSDAVLRLDPAGRTAQVVGYRSSVIPKGTGGVSGIYTKIPPSVPCPPQSAPEREPGRAVTGILRARRYRDRILTSLDRVPRWGRNGSEIVDSLRGSDRAFGGPSARAKAEAAAMVGSTMGPAEAAMICPDRFWSIDRWFPTMERIETRTGRVFSKVVSLTNAGSALSLLDLDNLAPVETTPDPAVADRIRRAVRRASGGRLSVEAITATSRTGIHVAVRWWRFWPDTAAMYRDPGCLRTLEAVAAAVLRAVGRGGHVDRSSWHPGRNGRRAGWRVGKDGQAVWARLWWTRAAPAKEAQ